MLGVLRLQLRPDNVAFMAFRVLITDRSFKREFLLECSNLNYEYDTRTVDIGLDRQYRLTEYYKDLPPLRCFSFSPSPTPVPGMASRPSLAWPGTADITEFSSVDGYWQAFIESHTKVRLVRGDQAQVLKPIDPDEEMISEIKITGIWLQPIPRADLQRGGPCLIVFVLTNENSVHILLVYDRPIEIRWEIAAIFQLAENLRNFNNVNGLSYEHNSRSLLVISNYEYEDAWKFIRLLNTKDKMSSEIQYKKRDEKPLARMVVLRLYKIDTDLLSKPFDGRTGRTNYAQVERTDQNLEWPAFCTERGPKSKAWITATPSLREPSAIDIIMAIQNFYSVQTATLSESLVRERLRRLQNRSILRLGAVYLGVDSPIVNLSVIEPQQLAAGTALSVKSNDLGSTRRLEAAARH